MNSRDTLALLDRLLANDPDTARPAGLTVRLKRLRELVATTGDQPLQLQAIADQVFPGVSANSFRTAFSEFRKSLASAAQAAGLQLELVRPDARGTGLEEVICHFTGTPLPRHPEMKSLTLRAAGLPAVPEVSEEERAQLRSLASSAAAERPGTPLVRPRVAAFRGSQLEEITRLPLRPADDGREQVRFFVSYAHKDAALAQRLLGPLVTDLHLSTRFRYEFWRDHLILPGELWHDEIQDALRDCDFGLALLSREFLSSSYITGKELPALAAGEKPVIPICLGLLDFDRQNLRGLDVKQIYRYAYAANEHRCFSQCSGAVTERFISDLAKNIEGRVSKSIQQRKEALTMRALAEPETLSALAQENPEFHAAILNLQRIREEAAARPANPAPKPQKHQHAALRGMALHMLPPELKAQVEATAALIKLSDAERLAAAGDTVLASLERHRQDALKSLISWFRDPAQPPFAAVLGEIGSGKTTLLQMLARALVTGQPHDAPPVFFVDLRDYLGDTDPTLEHLLADQLRRHDSSGQLTVQDIKDAVHTGGALIIFDGLDEKIIPLADGPRQRFVSELFRILPPDIIDRSAATGRGRIIISCRSHYFPSVLALASSFVDQQRARVRTSDYTAFFMLPWNEKQVADYLAQSLGQKRVPGALEIIASIHNLTDLSRRPYLLSLIVPQLADMELRRAEGKPVNGASLYAAFVEKWLLRDDGKHQFTKEHKLLMMECLAADLWRDNAREWPWSRVADWLDQFLYENPRIADRYARSHISADILNQDFRTATFFLRPDTSKDGFRFAHTSLQEYFLASRLVKSLAAPNAAAVWDLPTPSQETFDFAGQIVETMSGSALSPVLNGLRALLESSVNTSQAWQTAVGFLLHLSARDLPSPENVALNARGLDLTAWEFTGTPQRPLRLGRADFSGAGLIRARFHNVKCSASLWQGADLRSAEFIGCGLENADFPRVRLEGARLRACRLAGSNVRDALMDGLRVDLPLWDAATAALWRNAAARARSTEFGSPPGAQPEAAWSLGHAKRVQSVAFSPDGGRLLSGSWDSTLRLWDAATGECLRVCEGHGGEVRSVAFSPDGTRLLSGADDNTLRHWDAATGECLRVCKGHTGWILGVAFSPDIARLLSGSGDKSLRLWDAATGECMRVCKGHAGGVQSVAFSPDGRRLLSGSSDKTLRLWDATTGECLRVCAGHDGTVQSVAFSPDGSRLLSGSSDKTLRLWDAATGECLSVCKGHADAVLNVAFSPDGTRVLSGSGDKSLRLWDAAKGECLRVCEGHAGGVQSVAFSPDGSRLLSGSWDSTLRLWNAATEECLRIYEGHAGTVESTASSHEDTRFVARISGDTFRFWDAATGNPLEPTGVPQCLVPFLMDSRYRQTLNRPAMYTCRWTLPDGTEMDRAILPDDGYAVLQRRPGGRWRLVRARGDYWRYVNYAEDTPEGRRLHTADALGEPERLPDGTFVWPDAAGV